MRLLVSTPKQWIYLSLLFIYIIKLLVVIFHVSYFHRHFFRIFTGIFLIFFHIIFTFKKVGKKSRTKIRTSLTYKLLWYSVTAEFADFIIALEFYFRITVIDILLKNEPISLQNGISRVFEHGFVTFFQFLFIK